MSQAPGWYRDPFFSGQERYWDGKVWTQGSRAPGADAAAEQPGVPAAPDPASAAPPADVPLTASTPSYAPLGAPVPAAMALPAVVPTGWAPPAATEQTGRRTQRRLAVLGIGAAALVLVGTGVAAALVLGQPDNASASAAVATAATQTLSAESADMSMSMDMSFLGLHETMTGSGAFDFAHHTGTMTMQIPVGAKQLTEQAIYDGSTVYVNVGTLLGSLAQGKQWVSEDLGKTESAAGGLNGVGTFGDPASMLQQLQSIGGTVTSLGPTTYEGTPVTEYSATLSASVLEGELGQLPSSLQKAVSGLSVPNITMDVYIGQGNLLKAMHMPVSFSEAGQSVSMDMTMSFSNYGTPVNVTPPPANEVEPLGQLGSGLGLGNTGSTGNTGISGSSGNTGAIF
ncbi:MAG TPA: DUF2510 domain-containing protein [Acidimicrobiales bacterium]